MGIFEERLMAHIKLREGFKSTVYLDSLGKPTIGVGHLLTAKESQTYKLGSTVPQNVLNGWLEEDIAKALNAAREQERELGTDSIDFLLALVSVNFQLGTGWRSKFPSAWRHLKNKEYERAISEIEFVKEGSSQKSQWALQTPVRVKDFVDALRKLKS